MLEGGVQPAFTNAAQARQSLGTAAMSGGFAACRGLVSRMAGDPHLFPPEDDPVEVWGRRIGRALAVVAGIVLVAYLMFTYLS
ncbi:MAG: hypothetical protein K0R27_2405 [Xanthobacteraceae bacterium]|nr:hypothetical protein [Xanthobacteraceae bacterium]